METEWNHPTLAVASPEDSEATRAPAPSEPQPTVRPEAGRRGLSALDVASLTVGFGLLTGLIESGYWAIRAFGLGELIFLSPHLFWMAPVTQLALFAVPGVVLALVCRRMGRHASVSLAILVLAGLFWGSLLCLGPKLALTAHLLLATGLAAATQRLLARWPEQTLRLARHAACGLLATTAGIALVMVGGRRLHEHRVTATLPPAPAEVPNVLLVVLDTVRADALDPVGKNPATQTAFQELAVKGVAFDLAIAPSPWTLPSHASMFTGRPPGELSADWFSPLDDRFPTLAETLRSHGYLTAGFVANTRYASAWTGLARGFTRYEDFAFAWIDFLYSTALGRRILFSGLPPKLGSYNWPGRKPAEQVNADFLAWLSQQNRRPYFAFLNYWDAHDPYLAPEPFDEHHPKTLEEGLTFRHWWWLDKPELPFERRLLVRQAYDDCIRYVDRQLGLLFDELERRGELDNTLVIITSDHGEHFGEHGLFLHGNSLYQPLVHVPLAVVWPDRIPAGRRIQQPVGTQDLAATILDLIDLDAASPLPGNSLARCWKAETADVTEWPIISEVATQASAPPDHGRSPIARGPMTSLVMDGVKYIQNGDGAEELYDFRRDPTESNNLIDSDQYRDVLKQCREALNARTAGVAKRGHSAFNPETPSSAGGR